MQGYRQGRGRHERHSSSGDRDSFNRSNNSNPPSNQSATLTLRIILTRDEVGYLFGFDGVLLGQLRQQTGANLQMSEPPGFEQVLSINGSLEGIFKAFSLICRKLWDFITSLAANGGQSRPLVLRLAVPASQCGSIIGKQGAKVKEIRDLTSANIQVSQDQLPESNERGVEISGTGEACLQCTYHICCVMQEAPLRGELRPYNPGMLAVRGQQQGVVFGSQQPQEQQHDQQWKPVFLCGDKAYIIDGDVAIPAPTDLLRKELAKTPFLTE